MTPPTLPPPPPEGDPLWRDEFSVYAAEELSLIHISEPTRPY